MRQLFEEILEATWVVGETGVATIAAVGERCDEPFREEDLARLQAEGLLDRSDDELILTARGKRRARALVRCHRLAEALLYTVFDLNWETREAIACEVEHTLVPELADGICTLLGHPAECPDGKPIPPGACCVSHRQSIECRVLPLTELPPARPARVLFVKTSSPDRVQQLTACGLVPGITLSVFQRSPAFGLRFEGTELAIDRAVAADIFVSPLEGKESHPPQGIGKIPRSERRNAPDLPAPPR